MMNNDEDDKKQHFIFFTGNAFLWSWNCNWLSATFWESSKHQVCVGISCAINCGGLSCIAAMQFAGRLDFGCNDNWFAI